MAIAEATFGAVGNSHGLIAASPGAAKYTALIVGRTDLPSTAPSGVDWQPFESGFSENDAFFLSRTWPDRAAQRGGMVFTHTLIAPWKEIDTPDGLARLFAMLPEGSDRSRPVTDRPLAPAIPANASQHLGRLLDLLLSNKQPIVWVGETGLAETLAALWPLLPADLRSIVGFRLSFGTENAAILPRFVATPASLAQRWTGKPVLDPRTAPPPLSDVAASLLAPETGERIRAYADRFGVQPATVQDWAMLQQVWALSDAEGESAASLLMQLRFLVVLSPKASAGVDGKTALAKSVATALSDGSAQQIAAMRNLNLANWPDNDAVYKAVRAWTSAHAGIDDAGDAEGVWTNAFARTDTAPAWQTAVLAGFDEAAKTSDAAFWRAWWRRWASTPELIAPVLDRLPNRRKIESAIIGAAPEAIDPEIAERLLAASASKHWLVLHAVVAVRSRPLLEALERHLQVDADEAHTDGLAAMLADRDGAARVATALRFKDPRLLAFASEAAAVDRNLLNTFDANDATWRQILVGAVRRDGEVWRGLADLSATRVALMALIRDDALEGEFVDAMSGTDVADLSEIADREAIWDKLPDPSRQHFINRTAQGWLHAFDGGANNPADLEDVLHAAVIGAAVASPFLESATPAIALRFFEAFADASEQLALAWLRHLKEDHRTLSAADAERLGRLLKDRRWHRAASALASLMHTDQGLIFAPAAMMLRGMLQFAELQRLWVQGILPVDSDDEVWRMFENVAAKLYPSGPNDSALWSTAGGDPSDLPFGRSGRTLWHNTLRDMRRGRHDVTAPDLLSAMRADYPNNSDLKWLAQQKALRDD